MLKAYKYRIYPNRDQKKQIAKTFGCCRFLYNQTLAYRKDAYENEKKPVSRTGQGGGGAGALPVPPNFSRSALRFGRGIFEPPIAIGCTSQTPIKRAWELCGSLQQRKSGIRSNQSWHRPGSVPGQ